MMNARAMARGFLQIAAILLLVAFWSTVFWLIPEGRAGETGPWNVADVAGLRSGMSVDRAQAFLSTWGAPFKIGPARPVERPAAAPAQAVTITVGRGPSPFGNVLRGSLLFLEDRLYWVDLELDGTVLETIELRYLGPPSGERWMSSRYWRLETQKGWAYVTGDWRRHHLTLAFHGALFEAGMIDAGAFGEIKDAFEDEVRDALDDPEVR